MLLQWLKERGLPFTHDGILSPSNVISSGGVRMGHYGVVEWVTEQEDFPGFSQYVDLLAFSLSILRSHHPWKCQILGENTPEVTDDDQE